MSQQPSRPEFDQLLGWILEVGPGETREERLREAIGHTPDLEAILTDHVRALEDFSWFAPTKSPEELPSDLPDRAEKWFGRWQVISPIAGGGTAEVYEAVRLVRGAPMRGALKILKKKEGYDEEHFESELMALVQVAGHPNVIHLLDGDITDDGRFFLVMELVEGCQLEEWVQQKELDIRARIVLFCQVLDALEWVHSRGRVHRDVAPRNLRVHDGRVKLLDFGAALDANEDSDGPPSWMTDDWASPEQRNWSSRGTARSDQYSAALVLRSLLTGDDVDGATQDSGLPPPSRTKGLDRKTRSELSGDLDAIVGKALAIDPLARYESVGTFREDLGRYLRSEPVSVVAPTHAYRIRKFRRREPKAFRAFGALTVAVMLVLLFFSKARVNQERAERRARAISDLTRFVLGQSLDQLADLPGTLKARDSIVRSVEASLNQLSTEADTNTELAITLARAHLKMSVVSRALRGSTISERDAAVQHTSEALRLLERAGGRQGPVEVREMIASVASRRAEWATGEEAVEWRQRAVDLRRTLAQAGKNDWILRRELADALKELADAQIASGRLALGAQTYEEALKLREQLVSERSLDREALRELATFRRKMDYSERRP